jgi:hypothetical protein
MDESVQQPPDPQPVPSPLRTRSALWLIIALLGALLLCLIAVVVVLLPQSNRNRLALGDHATLSQFEIEIQEPIELDFLTRAEVFDLREQAVQRYPGLLQGRYRPSDAVFRQIRNKLPWWGMAGVFYYGSGEQSIEGASEESRFLLNPYLLVAADFYHNWIAVPEAEVLKPGVALDCAPQELLWNPRERWGLATYSANCIRGINNQHFDLISYNARDFNLNYIYVKYDESRNIAKEDPPTGPFKIPHYIHQGNSCGYPGGCNNMSPPSPEIDFLEITGFPAEVVVWLWEAEPSSPTQPPDMVFLVRFQ